MNEAHEAGESKASSPEQRAMRWTCAEHQDSTRQVCPCVGFDGRCHECPDPTQRPPCQDFTVGAVLDA